MLAAHLGLGEEDILEARLARQGRDAASMQERLGVEDHAPTREDQLGAKDHGFAVAEERVLLLKLLGGVTPRERRAVALRIAGDMTQREVGEAIGVSAMQASRIVRGALDRMEATAATR